MSIWSFFKIYLIVGAVLLEAGLAASKRISIDHTIGQAICQQMVKFKDKKSTEGPIDDKSKFNTHDKCEWIQWNKCSEGTNCAEFKERCDSNGGSGNAVGGQVTAPPPPPANGKPSAGNKPPPGPESPPPTRPSSPAVSPSPSLPIVPILDFSDSHEALPGDITETVKPSNPAPPPSPGSGSVPGPGPVPPQTPNPPNRPVASDEWIQIDFPESLQLVPAPMPHSSSVQSSPPQAFPPPVINLPQLDFPNEDFAPGVNVASAKEFPPPVINLPQLDFPNEDFAPGVNVASAKEFPPPVINLPQLDFPNEDFAPGVNVASAKEFPPPVINLPQLDFPNEDFAPSVNVASAKEFPPPVISLPHLDFPNEDYVSGMKSEQRIPPIVHPDSGSGFPNVLPPDDVIIDFPEDDTVPEGNGAPSPSGPPSRPPSNPGTANPPPPKVPPANPSPGVPSLSPSTPIIDFPEAETDPEAGHPDQHLVPIPAPEDENLAPQPQPIDSAQSGNSVDSSVPQIPPDTPILDVQVGDINQGNDPQDSNMVPLPSVDSSVPQIPPDTPILDFQDEGSNPGNGAHDANMVPLPSVDSSMPQIPPDTPILDFQDEGSNQGSGPQDTNTAPLPGKSDEDFAPLPAPGGGGLTPMPAPIDSAQSGNPLPELPANTPVLDFPEEGNQGNKTPPNTNIDPAPPAGDSVASGSNGDSSIPEIPPDTPIMDVSEEGNEGKGPSDPNLVPLPKPNSENPIPQPTVVYPPGNNNVGDSTLPHISDEIPILDLPDEYPDPNLVPPQKPTDGNAVPVPAPKPPEGGQNSGSSNDDNYVTLDFQDSGPAPPPGPPRPNPATSRPIVPATPAQSFIHISRSLSGAICKQMKDYQLSKEPQAPLEDKDKFATGSEPCQWLQWKKCNTRDTCTQFVVRSCDEVSP